MRPGTIPALSILLVVLLSPGCRSKTPDSTIGGVVSTWAYPVRLGDPRSKVHEFLGNAARTTEVVEDYPMSGVSVSYNPEGRVAKLSFSGDASALYSAGSFDSIPSDRPLMFGLTAQMDETGFRHLLGAPVRKAEFGAADAKEARLVWRKDGYVVDALFLASDRPHQGRILSRGRLVWFEVSPGI